MFRQMGLILVGCAASVALGQSLIEAENLLYSPPKDFKVGFNSTHDNYLITEFVPANQTVNGYR